MDSFSAQRRGDVLRLRAEPQPDPRPDPAQHRRQVLFLGGRRAARGRGGPRGGGHEVGAHLRRQGGSGGGEEQTALEGGGETASASRKGPSIKYVRRFSGFLDPPPLFTFWAES